VITQGDPAGVGPEVIVGAWTDPSLHERADLLVAGHPEVLRSAARLLGVNLEVAAIREPEEARSSPGVLPCLACGGDDVLELSPGVVDARGGQAAYDALVSATKLALAGRVDAITTAPLSKAALWKAGHQYPGHTELLGELCGVDEVAMMLYLPPGEAVRGRAGLGVVHVTLHMAMRDVFAHLTVEEILAKCRLADQVMRRLKGAPPKLAVCALNPHAGEGGLFGDEEQTRIRPAVEAGRAEGMLLEGPLPTDTLMVRAADGEFDGVVAMYHDQGHIALKLLGMHRAVNVTLGLPIIRTSVAHGTANDRAWQGVADHGGMIAALTVASELTMTNDE
jgi:4-hydroxythreonine-4-phosphate dehydrogenase